MKMKKELINIINNLEDETPEDKEQIKRALYKTKYTLYVGEDNAKTISCKKAAEILGSELLISGLERSAFHWTATRSKENITVFFDSSNLFKEEI
jgi:hypothetical protein